MNVYNDLLILQHIIPNLSKDTLRELLPEIRKIEKQAEKQEKEEISLEGVLLLLSSTGDEDPLLNDFLQSAVWENQVVVKGC